MIGGCFLTVVGCECQALYFTPVMVLCLLCAFGKIFFFSFCNAVLKLLAEDYFYGGSCNSSHYYIDTLFLCL